MASATEDEGDPAPTNTLQRQRSIRQAVEEGHDADIPSDLGFIPTEEDRERRRRSIAASHRSKEDPEMGLGPDDKSRGTEEEETDDANIVWWTDDDPENPYNWPFWTKVINCALVSLLTFVSPLASSILAPGVGQLMEGFQSDNNELSSFVVSVYVLGYATGPLLIAPLSEIYGRIPVYHICNLGLVVFTTACALAPSLTALIVFRFLSGTFASCPMTNSGGTIADMIPQEQRGKWMSMYTVGPLFAPIIGPIAGGFLADAKGWRWTFWIIVIVAGVLAVAMLLLARESYAPVILQRRVMRLRKETGNDMLRSKLDAGLSKFDYFKRSIVRPLRMLAKSPICIIYALYVSIIYGYLYLLFTSISEVFMNNYFFDDSVVGLVFLGLGVGSLAGLVYFTMTNDRIVRAKSIENGGPGYKPEDRLAPLPIGAILLPTGFFIYGWTAQYRVHWIIPIMSHALIGFGNVLIFMAIITTLVDTFTLYAASALAANTVVRSIFGAVLPLCGLEMYNDLGIGWGNSLLGFIALAMVPAPWLIMRYGETLRKKYPIKNL
ncbi:bicyclomycin resistance protein [Rhypophila decipiens]